MNDKLRLLMTIHYLHKMLEHAFDQLPENNEYKSRLHEMCCRVVQKFHFLIEKKSRFKMFKNKDVLFLVKIFNIFDKNGVRKSFISDLPENFYNEGQYKSIARRFDQNKIKELRKNFNFVELTKIIVDAQKKYTCDMMNDFMLENQDNKKVNYYSLPQLNDPSKAEEKFNGDLYLAFFKANILSEIDGIDVIPDYEKVFFLFSDVNKKIFKVLKPMRYTIRACDLT